LLQLGDRRLPAEQALLNARWLCILEPVAVALTDAENLPELVAPAVPSIDAKAEARLLVCADEVTELAVPFAVELAVAEAVAVVLSASALTSTLSRNSALASLFVMLSPEKMPDDA